MMLRLSILVWLLPALSCLKPCSITRQPLGPEFCRVLCSQTGGVQQCRYLTSQMKCEAVNEGKDTGPDVMMLTHKQAGSSNTNRKEDCKKFSKIVIARREDVVCISPCHEKTRVLRRLPCPPVHVRSLFKAVKIGDLSRVKTLVTRGMVKVNCRQKSFTAAMIAAQHLQEKIFDFLVQQKCDLLAISDFKDDVLHFACDAGSKSIVEKLLNGQEEFFINRRGSSGRTPLMYATVSGNLPLVKLLIERGAKITLTSPDGVNIIHIACIAGDLNLVKYLISFKELQKMKSNARDILLDLAMKNGHQGIVPFLKSREI